MPLTIPVLSQLSLRFRLYVTFWLLSISDLSAPIGAYEREIERCKKGIADLSGQAAGESVRDCATMR